MESGKRSKVISYNDLYEIAMDYTTYSQSVTGYDAEGQISSAIAYVTSEEMPVVYQLTGHEEQPLGSTFTDAVGKLNVTLESLNLLAVGGCHSGGCCGPCDQCAGQGSVNRRCGQGAGLSEQRREGSAERWLYRHGYAQL